MFQSRFNTALRELCAMVTREGHAHPGTGLKLAFEGPLLANLRDVRRSEFGAYQFKMFLTEVGGGRPRRFPSANVRRGQALAAVFELARLTSPQHQNGRSAATRVALQT